MTYEIETEQPITGKNYCWYTVEADSVEEAKQWVLNHLDEYDDQFVDDLESCGEILFTDIQELEE